MTIAERLAALYAKVPTFKCKEGCTDCCGPVPFIKAEWDKVDVKKDLKPGCLDCPYAKADGGCEIYEHRPFMCRLFGTVEDLACPHGCAPEKLFTKAEGNALVDEYIRIGQIEEVSIRRLALKAAAEKGASE